MSLTTAFDRISFFRDHALSQLNNHGPINTTFTVEAVMISIVVLVITVIRLIRSAIKVPRPKRTIQFFSCWRWSALRPLRAGQITGSSQGDHADDSTRFGPILRSDFHIDLPAIEILCEFYSGSANDKHAPLCRRPQRFFFGGNFYPGSPGFYRAFQFMHTLVKRSPIQ